MTSSSSPVAAESSAKRPKLDYNALLDSYIARSPVRLSWTDVSADMIIPLAQALVDKSKATLDGVVAEAGKNGSTVNWSNTIAPLAALDASFSTLENMLTFPSHVAADKGKRDASTEADKILSAFHVEAASRKDIYEVFVAYEETDEAKMLEGERKRYIERNLRDFRRRGLHLDESTAEKVKVINKRISDLGIAFSKNLGDESTKFRFTAQELDGCPDSWLAERKQDDGTYEVSLKYPCYIPVMEQCRIEKTRKKMEAAFNSRCINENTKILEELVTLRHEKAQLMQYDTHADFITEVRMSKNKKNVVSFLDELASKLQPLLESDLDELISIKKSYGSDDAVIRSWDRSFYCKRLWKRSIQSTMKSCESTFQSTSSLLAFSTYTRSSWD